MRLTSSRTLLLGAVVCAIAVAEPAAAQVQPAGTGEPLFTNSQQNTQHFEWPATSGADAYRIRFDHPAQGQYSWPNDSLFYSDGPNSCSMGTQLGRRAYTTIDRSKPGVQVKLAGGAEFTNDAKVGVHVDYSDDLALPYPANFMCFQFGGGPSNVCDSNAGFVYGYNVACSVPNQANRITSFDCTADFGSGDSPAPDGTVWTCAIGADASIPDNPSSANQSQSAEKANLSAAHCDGVTLDRAAPTVGIAASATAAKVGDLVSFEAQAADATSGLSGSYQWTWGDNTAGGAGGSATHTFTQPGTYSVRLETTDKAGNSASATKVITVTAPSTGNGGTGNGGTGNGSTGNGTTGTGTSTSTTTINEIVTQAGGSGSQTLAVGGALEVVAPRKLALAKARGVLAVALTADAPGTASIALVRAGRVLARSGAKLAAAGTVGLRLRLPKKVKAGAHVLKVTFKPAGGKATTSTLKVRLVGKAKAKQASAAHASSHAGVAIEGAPAPTALPDGRFHGDRPARTFAARGLAAR